MPCSHCQSLLIFWDEWICPICNKFSRLDSVTATEISKLRVEHIQKLWRSYVSKLDKRSVIAHMIWQREKLCREFFSKYSILNIEDILSQTLLIKRLINIEFTENGEKIDDEEKAKKILKLYGETVRIEEEHIHIESCLAKMLYLKKFEMKNLSSDDLFQDFLIFPNERFENLKQSYSQYNIMTEKEASEKISEWKPEFDELMKKPIIPHEFTREEFVSKMYDVICTIYFGFLRNRLYLEAFDLRNFNDLFADPSELMKFVNGFVLGENGISVCNTAEFLIRSKKFFGKDISKLRKILLFEEENLETFPLFIRIKDKEYDYVFISHKFSALMYTFLHATITKDLFDKETAKRGKNLK